jgi:hypothetical protein
MIRPMNFRMPPNEDIHTAFAQGEAAVMALFHAVATQVAELAQQLAKQGEVLWSGVLTGCRGGGV